MELQVIILSCITMGVIQVIKDADHVSSIESITFQDLKNRQSL